MTKKLVVVKPRRKKEEEDPRVKQALDILRRMLDSFREAHSKAS